MEYQKPCFAYRSEKVYEIYRKCKGTDPKKKVNCRSMTCVTDPYGNPYVPGSSLKGMLRTILLSKDIAQDQIKYKRDQSQIRSELSAGRKKS